MIRLSKKHETKRIRSGFTGTHGTGGQTFDNLGIIVSALCVLHCLLSPLLILALPLLGTHFGHDDLTHKALAFLVLSFALVAVFPGYLRHRKMKVLLLMISGLSLVLLATFACGSILSESWEIPLISVGNLLVIIAHLKNRKLCCSA